LENPLKKIIVILAGILFIAEWVWAAPLRVVTTTADLAAITQEVGDLLVKVESLTRGSQDPHFVETRPSLMLKASRADLFIQVGLGLETGWAPALLVGARNPRIQPGLSGYLDASQNIEVLGIPPGPVDRSRGDVHPLGNPHYWLDPENGKAISQNIAQSLTALLPNRSQIIDQNQNDFVRKLDEAITRWKNRMRPYQGIQVVTYHNSWTYFARRFGLDVVGYVEPKPGIPPSPAHINQLIALMKQQKVKLIIMEPYFSRSIPDLVSRETGAKVLVLPPSVGGSKGVNTYLDLFEHLISQLTTAFIGAS
jgi:zinc/manganese transport system substrate-binding protein